MDRISLKEALEHDLWEIVWAGEPNRKISVEMTYNDLKIIKDTYEFKAEIKGWNVCCEELLGGKYEHN